MAEANWQNESEKNRAIWLTLLLWGVRILGRTVMRCLVLPFVVLFFIIFGAGARRNSQAFLSRVLAEKPGLAETAKHFYTFASVSTDRILLMDDGASRFEVELVNEDCFDDIADGAILITSHFGSFDVMRVLADRERSLDVHILLDVAHNARALSLLGRLNPAMASMIVDASMPGPALILKLKNLLESNALVGIMADRVVSNQRNEEVLFLGDTAEFPMGPWLLAAMLKRPVIVCFGAFQGGNRYRVEFQRVDLAEAGRTQARAFDGMRKYVALLEEQVRQHPYNWFNFYDFWGEE